MTTSALVLFSGGQDSTTCLAWALGRFDRVETVGFDYGQRHRSELDARPGLLAAMRLRPPEAAVFNLCTGIPTSVLDLAGSIAALAGTRLDATHRPPRGGEIRHSVGAPQRARAALGLPAPVLLQDGLRNVLDWMKGGR